MRALLFALLLMCMAVPAMAQSIDPVDDEPPHIGPSETEVTVGKMTGKLARGFVNVLTFLGELPKQIILTGRDEGFWAAISLGFLKGIGMSVVRLGAGLWDIAFFLSPWPENYEAILDPEYVWE
ncbi:MAG: exosortase system-associated protein, TIGR04073 family [Candidatus Brocadiae bacterium]|nr:exosortase system-associated protein, TIGR04073 family [Candidatus Brocadiia bacterium]